MDFTVNKTSDSGNGSLRNAIVDANNSAGTDRIVFRLSGGAGVKKISPTSPLPVITDTVVIDGFTQGGDGYGGPPLVEISGELCPPCNGLEVYSGGNTIRGLIINRFGWDGIVLVTNGFNTVEGNYLGTDATGTQALGNHLAGIKLVNSPHNVIGGTNSPARNIISGNQNGIVLLNRNARENSILGNYIGLDVTGTQSLGNTNEGVYLNALAGTTNDYPKDNLIGGNGPGARNFISGNGAGVAFEAFESGLVEGPISNRVVGNYVGTDIFGSTAIPNGTGVALWKASHNIIGGPNTNDGNLISGNVGAGISLLNARSNIIQGNLIGTDLLGLSELENFVGVRIADSWHNVLGGTTVETRNIISGNHVEGIRMGGTHATNNLIQNNFIGVDITGQDAVGNGGEGILVGTNSPTGGPASRNTIGEGKLGNVISGNGADGVQLAFGAFDNRLYGNIIGVSADSLVNLPNARHGVAVLDSTNNVIGSVLPGEGNTIAANGQHGIFIADGLLGAGSVSNLVQNNLIGFSGAGNLHSGVYVRNSSWNSIGGLSSLEGNRISQNGTGLQLQGHGVTIESGTNNPILSNLIWDNAGRGIDLGNDSFTLNDVTNSGDYDSPIIAYDTDAGANNLQNYPVVTGVRFDLLGRKWITWTLNSEPLHVYDIQFFSNKDCDRSGFGEGEKYLGHLYVVTDIEGITVFTNRFPESEKNIAVTATDAETFNTSEFSPVDLDGDAIADAWETPGQGIDVDEDGNVDFTPDGASPFIKDIFVEIDAMEDRIPNMANLNRVADGDPGKLDGFANAPWALIQNAPWFGLVYDGIQLHLELSDTNLPSHVWTSDDYIYLDALKENWFGSAEEQASPNWENINKAKRLFYRYCVFADRITGTNSTTTGRGQIGGNDFFIALGTNAPSPNSDAVPGTFMHELGHTLGLLHGGFEDNNLKPNYHSVMNYLWSDPAWYNQRDGFTLDYSREAFGDLIETNLVESAGIVCPGSHNGHLVAVGPWRIGTNVTGTKLAIAGGLPLDWNRNTNIDAGPISADINYWRGDLPSPGESLHGAEDWSRLKFYFLESHYAAKAVHPHDQPNDLPLSFLNLRDEAGADVGVIQFASSTYSISETGLLAAIPVQRIFERTGTVSVAFSTVDGTATSGQDYLATNGVLTFLGDETVRTVAIPILDNGISELPETVRIFLSNPTGGAILGPFAQATLTITDNDPTNHFTVINTNNTGAGSLRQAISDVNTNPGIAIIDFDIPASSGLTISPGSPLPSLLNTVTVDGTTQPGYTGAPIIELNGAGAGNSANGLALGGGNSTVRGLIINRFKQNGVLVGNGRNVIEGCYIGLNRSGLLDQGNGLCGIQVNGWSNTIGGLTLAQRNYIAGNNQEGIQLQGTNNLILGNVIGLGVDESDQGNTLRGVLLSGRGNIVGGEQPGARNVISGNDRDGIYATSSGNTILGNYIGTLLSGQAARANRSNGIALGPGGNNNLIGGDHPDAANLISGNGRYGISLSSALNNTILGNTIGLTATGEVALVNGLGGVLMSGSSRGNRVGDTSPNAANTVAYNNHFGVYIPSISASNNAVRGNRIWNVSLSVTSPGIDLGDQGFDSNDAGDADTGANTLQNKPALISATNSLQGTVVAGSLSSRSNTTYTIDFYANPVSTVDGRMWIGSTNVTTDASGDATFAASTPAVYLVGPHVTATATDGAGNTSEFCAPVTLSSSVPGRTVVVYNTGDSGPGSLRQAILDCNVYPSGRNRIEFDIPGAGVRTIAPLSALPPIQYPVLLDGYSQPGTRMNTSPTGNNAVLLIELDGSQAGAYKGLSILGGDSIVRGLVINRWGTNNPSLSAPPQAAIEVFGFGNSHVYGNFIGTDPTGQVPLGNLFRSVHIYNSSNNVIGGSSPEFRNVISATIVATNQAGVWTSGEAIALQASASLPGETANNRIEGNLIGTAADGFTPLGNQGPGVRFLPEATGTMIGGTLPGSGNVIAFNGSINQTVPATPPLGFGVGNPMDGGFGNSVLGNSIHSNDGPGIFGYRVNSWAGHGNFPFLSSAVSSNAMIALSGHLNSVSNALHRIEFFANHTFDSSGYGEGEIFLGATNVLTDSNGFVAFTAVLPGAVSNGMYVTATATDDENNTSPFSPRLRVGDVLTDLIVVNSLNDVDDGVANTTHTSLREAILAANNHTGPDTIQFAISPFILTKTIYPTELLPALMDAGTTIDATTQSGYAGKPLIYLNGYGSLASGFRLYSPSNSIRGFAINGFTYGIYGDGAYGSPFVGFNAIEGNYLGCDLTGSGGDGVQDVGVYLNSGFVPMGCFSNRIGGTTVAARNVISGNRSGGIHFYGCDGNSIMGNFVGPDWTGTNALGNGLWTSPSLGGLDIQHSRGTIIGGDTPGARNVISGSEDELRMGLDCSDSVVLGNFFGTDLAGLTSLSHSLTPIEVSGTGRVLIQSNLVCGSSSVGGVYLNSPSNRVEGNLIGTDVTGTRTLGSLSRGVYVAFARADNIVGGTGSGSGNVIAGNHYGIHLRGPGTRVQGNTIGTQIDGISPLTNRGDGILIESSFNRIGGVEADAGNTIAFGGGSGVRIIDGTNNAVLGNAIFSNADLGIDLGTAGVTLNDVGDADAGPNDLQNFPIFTARNTGAATLIEGILSSQSAAAFRLEFFTNSSCDPAGYGEGRSLLAAVSAATDPSGDAVFVIHHSPPLPVGTILSATATDTGGNTSEFSPCTTVFNDTSSVAILFNTSPPYTLSWPVWASDFALERATNLAVPVHWEAVSDGITNDGGEYLFVITNIFSPAEQYFRLRQP